MKYSDRMRHASAISKAAKSYRAWGVKAFADDPKMIKVCRSDANELVYIAQCLRKGDVEEAADLANMCDTIVREAIPQKAYDALMEVFEEDSGMLEPIDIAMGLR